MANGYGVCPTCGCQPMGAWQGGQMWGGPAWGGQFQGGPGMMGQGMGPGMMGPFCGPGYSGAGYWPGYGPGYAPAYYGGLPTDSEIEEMIYDSIDADLLIPFDANIDISVEAGTVYLKGEVASKRIKHAAGDDAWWIPGVIDVHNEIKIAGRKRGGAEEEDQQ
jgi:hypothetical protein